MDPFKKLASGHRSAGGDFFSSAFTREGTPSAWCSGEKCTGEVPMIFSPVAAEGFFFRLPVAVEEDCPVHQQNGIVRRLEKSVLNLYSFSAQRSLGAARRQSHRGNSTRAPQTLPSTNCGREKTFQDATVAETPSHQMSRDLEVSLNCCIRRGHSGGMT